MKIIAHRGASARFEENTVKACLAAAQLGADMIEVDLQQTKDGFFVLRHNSCFADGTWIKDMHFSEFKRREIEEGKTVTLLNDLFVEQKGLLDINIELKHINDVSSLLPVIESYSTEKLLFSSFNHNLISDLKFLNPEIRTATLLVSRLIDTISVINSIGSDVLCQNYLFVDSELVDEVHNAGKQIIVWTVNFEEDIKKCLSMGVDGIFTDYPEMARKMIG